MRREDWDKLCRNIYEKNCILLLGSEFPLETNQANEPTSFSKLLSAKLREELKDIDRVPASITNQIGYRELSQLACDYINYKQSDKKISREDIENLLTDYLTGIENEIHSDAFAQLATLPFTFIVNTNYTDFFCNYLKQINKPPDTDYYNFRGSKVDYVQSTTADTLGTELNPFIFNLFGSIENPSSLVISENDLVQFIINIISKNPGLPVNVKSELADQAKCFLFLGFDFYVKNWYFRILLQALESNNKDRMSYALECFNNIQNQSFDDNPIVLFFRDELKVSLYADDQKQFIESLVTNFNSYLEKRKGTSSDKILFENAPKVFISYKSQDYKRVNEIYLFLRKSGINAWLDREKLQGKWNQAITTEIANSDAFILIQSQQLNNEPVNFVNVEIKEALQRAKYYASEADFLFPAFIDSSQSVLTEYKELKEINSYDLTAPDKIEQLAKDIKRSYERNKRKRAA